MSSGLFGFRFEVLMFDSVCVFCYDLCFLKCLWDLRVSSTINYSTEIWRHILQTAITLTETKVSRSKIITWRQ